MNGATGAAPPPRAGGMLTTLRDYGRLARLEGGGFSVVAIFGAFAARGAGTGPRLVGLLFAVNLLFILGGCIHNDLVDVDVDRQTDKLGERPVVSGAISRLHAALAAGACFSGCVILASFLTPELSRVGVLVGAIACALLYNMSSKRLLGADLFFAVSAAWLCLYGGLAATHGGGGPSGSLSGLAWIVVGVVFIDHFFFNAVEGGLKDFENDGCSGAPTIAHYLYRVLGKRPRLWLSTFLFALKVASVVLIAIPFLAWGYSCRPWQLIGLVVAGALTLVFSWRLLAMKAPEPGRVARLTKIQEMACRSLVPLLLASVAGVGWMLVLVLAPFVWFFLFNYMLHGAAFSNAKTI